MAETMSRLDAPAKARATRPGWIDRLARRAILTSLSGIREGRLELKGLAAFGREGSAASAAVEIRDHAIWRRALLGGDVGLGESYRDGHWAADDLVAVLRLAIRNMEVFDRAGGACAWAGRWFDRRTHATRDNSPGTARRNIADHYDLGNEFYRVFLDPTLAYSCAVYGSDGESLEAAQVRKYDSVCRALRLSPDDHLLEIGTGWGGFAVHAALATGCRVTTTTISRRQHEFVAARLRELGLADRITLLADDYRDLRGTFDKVAAIEMFEAVGYRHYDAFFSTLDRLLRPGGEAFLQTITMNERRFEAYRRRPDFIQIHVFPGAELASVRGMLASMQRVSSLTLVHMEEIGHHYARTLRTWRERFLARLDAVRELGFDEKFIRKWEYYLAYCEAGFLERWIGNAQMVLRKGDRC